MRAAAEALQEAADPSGLPDRVTPAQIDALVDDLARPTAEIARVIEAVADGDLARWLGVYRRFYGFYFSDSAGFDPGLYAWCLRQLRS